jgi:DNA polymerase III sliding clamp (beta) subunit (PCNA family)
MSHPLSLKDNARKIFAPRAKDEDKAAKPVVSIPLAALRRGMRMANLVVERRTTIPVLAYVFLSSDKRGLFVQSTNLDTTIRTYIDKPNRTYANGITLPARKITNCLAAIAADDIGLTDLGDNKARLAADGFFVEFNTYNVQDVPAMKNTAGVFEFSTSDVETFRGALIRATEFAAKDEIRYPLHGVNIAAVDNFLNVTASDGHVLFRTPFTPEAMTADGMSATINPKGVRSIIEASMGADYISVAADARHFVVTCYVKETVSAVVSTTLIEAAFPSIDRISDGFQTAKAKAAAKNAYATFEVIPGALLLMIKRMTAALESQTPKGTLHVGVDFIEIHATNATGIKARDRISAIVHGQCAPTSFNIDLLQRSLTGFRDGLQIAICDRESPIRLSSKQDDATFAYLMPMRP